MGKIGDGALVFLMVGVQKETLSQPGWECALFQLKQMKITPGTSAFDRKAPVTWQGGQGAWCGPRGGNPNAASPRLYLISAVSARPRVHGLPSLDDKAVVCRVKEGSFWSASLWNPELRPAHVA